MSRQWQSGLPGWILSIALFAYFMTPMVLCGQGQRQGNNPQAQQNNRQTTARGGIALPALLRTVQDRPPASILTIDGDGTWEPLIASMLRQDPLIALNLNFIGLNFRSGAGSELIQREGWSAGVPRWCLMAPDGAILYSSESYPSPTLILDAFKGAGLQSRMDILKWFLANHPDHAEARLALLGELRAVAEIKTQNALGIPGVRRAGTDFLSGTNNALSGQGSPPQLLETSIDSDIWGEYARESDRAFQDGIWKQDIDQLWGRGSSRGVANIGMPGGLFRGGGTSMVSNLGQHSPMMKRLYHRWLPDIESALFRRPSSFQLWDFWLIVQRAAGGRDLGDLIANMVPGPDNRTRDIPPPMIRRDWIRDCINREDWRMAEDVARTTWEQLLLATAADLASRTVQSTPGLNGRARIGSTTPLNTTSWSNVAEPYIEVLLRQQKTGIADAVLQQWFSYGGWIDAAQRARNLANRLGFADLGNRWGSYAQARR